MQYRMLGQFALASGRMAEALELLERAIREDHRDPAAHLGLGCAQIALKRPLEAVSALRRALELDPKLAGAHNALGLALKELGRLDEARICFERALEIDARSVEARIGLGNTLLGLGEFQAAIDGYRTAIAAGQTGGPVRIALGAALKEAGDDEGSLEAFQQAVAADPQSWQAHLSLASALLELGRFAESIGSVREAIRLGGDPAVVEMVYGIALAASGDLEGAIDHMRRALPTPGKHKQILAVLSAKLLNIGLHERALECFHKQLEADPEDLDARHFVAALSEQNPDEPAEDYIRGLFDQFAETFDHHLLATLGYTVPREIVRALLAASSRAPPWDVLDLGSGTGLVGREIAAYVRTPVGVDLSPKMIDRARACEAYTELRVGDLRSALVSESPARYDVVTAADVLLYLGKLDPIVPEVRRLLRSDGMFAFTVEAGKATAEATSGERAEGYLLMPTGRYVHDEDYLRGLASRNDFDIRIWRKVRLRTERRRPVMGWLTVWVRRAPPAH